ncbi:MAG TPA: 3-dehydroquinate synthase family protein, partial [Acidimicrobiia bacterium]
MESFSVGLSEVVLTRGLPDSLLPRSDARRQAVVLTQPGAGLYADRVAKLLKDENLSVEVIGLPDRDEAKSIDVAITLYDRFARMGLARTDTVVTVGGGSVTDVGGFVAGTWMRGIEVVHIPTTLLAAVDASVGGKTGINMGGKNLVGVFWEPSRVVIDYAILDELPSMLVLEGLAEVLKAGFIGDLDLIGVIESEGLDAPLESVVPAALRVKAKYVRSDLRESSERAFLNFGHTFGHAVEFASSLSHGVSVGIGMVAAAAVSEQVADFSGRVRLYEIVTRLGIYSDVSGLDRNRVYDLLF